MKKYTEPEVEIIKFANEDVITTSGTTEDDEYWGDNWGNLDE